MSTKYNPPKTDEELVNALGLGCESAFVEIYKKYNRLLLLHAYKKMGNKEDAQDIVQEVFSKLWQKRKELELQQNLAGYLYTMVRNRIYNLIAHKSVGSEYIKSFAAFAATESPFTDERIREKQFKELIEKEISMLPPRMKEAFVLSRHLYLTHKEIANVMQTTESTVTDQIKKALKVLKPKLGLVLLMFLNFIK